MADLPTADTGTPLPRLDRPLLLAVHSNPAMARGLENDLRRQYQPRGFEAICVDSGRHASSLLEDLSLRDAEVALLVIDQEITGVQASKVIAQARDLHPNVRTVLLIEHHGMEKALEAMNEGSLDYFFVKPLAPPEDQLFPVTDDLLDDWSRWRENRDRAVKVVGHRSQRAHPICGFLTGNDVHWHFFDLDEDDKALMLLGGQAPDSVRLPLVIFDDGGRLEAPNAAEIAIRLGIKTQPTSSSYDLVIVGGGPAGLAAAVYGASEGLGTLLVEREAPGGQAGQSSKIENYLGFPGGLQGRDLTQRALRQVHKFKAEIVRPCEVAAIRTDGADRIVTLSDQTELHCHTALISTGVSYRRLEAPGVEELTGRGVFYGAAATDAPQHGGKHVFIVGGANSAGQAALHFAEHARQVTMLVRSGSLTKGMSQYLVDRIENCRNIDVMTETTVRRVDGDEQLETLTLRAAGSESDQAVSADALFIFIGAAPRTDWVGDSLLRDERGFILTGRDLAAPGKRPDVWQLDRDPLPLETCVPGVFAAGDVRHGSTKRVAAAVGEGGMAVQLIHQHLSEPP